MKKELLNYLVCPKCKKQLKIETIDKSEGNEIIEGTLKCDCGCKYPIILGLPRMFYNTVEGVHKSSNAFSRQWNIYDYKDEKEETWMSFSEEKRLKRVMTAFNIKPEDLKGKVILDAGCGNGRLSFSLSKLGCEVVAMDISSGVEHASRIYKNDKLHYVKGDLMELPLKSESFDYVWCSGVLHHTPSTKKSFDNLVPVVKKNGILYIWVYGWHPNKRPLFCTVKWGLGKIMKNSPNFFKDLVCFFCMAGIFHQVLKGKHRINPTLIRQRRRIFNDSIVPYSHHQSPSEVKNWFKEHSFKNIEMPIEDFKVLCGYGIRGIRK